MYLKKKLFFSSAIRYMIESNLKITHNSVFFLAITGSFESTSDKVFTILTCALLVVIVLWPFFVTAFLLHNRKRLKSPRFKLMFQSMYLGIKTDNHLGNGLTVKKTECLLYNVVFCLRRLALVVCYLYFKDGLAGSVLYAILAIQTIYIVYIVYSKPHVDSYFNILEVFNETSVILIVYSLQGFISSSLIEPALQWSLGYLTIGLISTVCLVNLILMIVITPKKIIRFLKKRKLRKALEAREKKLARQKAAQVQESMK